MKKSPTIFLNY